MSTVMKLDLPYRKPAESTEPNYQTTINLIEYCINSTYKDGVKGQMRRSVGRLQAKLQDAEDNKATTIELEESEKDIIKQVVRDVATPPGWSKHVNLIEDEIESWDKVPN